MKFLALAPLLASTALAQGTVHVPGDFADLQLALDSVASGTTIVVHGGTWSALSIHTPVTLVGDPRPLIESAPPLGPGLPLRAPVTLAGNGVGAVRLVELDLGGAGPPPGSTNAPAIEGAGFDALSLFGCDVFAPTLAAPTTGLVRGQPGIDVDVARLQVVESHVRASATTDDSFVAAGANGAPGIRTTGDAVVLDALVEGGGFLGSYSLFGSCFMNPGPCTSGGKGGAAVEALALYTANSQLSPGLGVDWYDAFNTFCCTGSDGPVSVATQHVGLPNSMELIAPARIGQALVYTFDAGVCGGSLFASPGEARVTLHGLGLVFVDPASVFFVGVLPDVSGAAGPQVVANVPNDPALVGQVFTTQLLSCQGLGRPVSFAIGF